jgi:hypothetical protein
MDLEDDIRKGTVVVEYVYPSPTPNQSSKPNQR